MLKILDVEYEPSGQMVDDYGLSAANHAQDLAAITVLGDTATVAVFDGAKDLAGTKWRVPELAAIRGLDEDLDGGEIVSEVMQQFVEEYPRLVGNRLIEGLNAALADIYNQIGLKVDLTHRERLFTGYIGHVRITEESVILTSVGDCYVAINGQIVVGCEKPIDTLHGGLVNAAAAELGCDRQSVYQTLMPVLNLEQFRFQNNEQMTWTEVLDYRQWAVDQTARLLGISLNRANELLPLANNSELLWYPALDGTSTPPSGIVTKVFERADVHRVVAFTDGFKPPTDTHDVWSTYDLVPINPRFSERLAVEIHLDA